MPSVPLDLVPYDVVDGEVLPVYFDRRDLPWIREALEVYWSLVGLPRRELVKRLERPVGGAVRFAGRESRDPRLERVLRHVLDQLFDGEVVAAVPPRTARRVLFGAAARLPRTEALRIAAAALRIGPEELRAALFADLPGARRVRAPAERIGPEAVALLANTAMIRALLGRAVDLRVALRGSARAVVRQARLAGLMLRVGVERADAEGGCDDGDGRYHGSCSGTSTDRPGRTPSDACVLHLAGPLSVLSQTTRYGRALARLVPALPWCAWFRATARCRVGSHRDVPLRLVLTTGSPIDPGPEPRRFDSELESRFARDLQRATADWRLLREPEPVAAGASLVFPDFELCSNTDPADRWWIEIVGFWTAEYLRHKLQTLRVAGLRRLVLCVDEARRCDAGDTPGFAHIVWFRGRRVDVAKVLGIVAAAPAGSRRG